MMDMDFVVDTVAQVGLAQRDPTNLLLPMEALRFMAD
jgi:hypothetical protein